MASSQLFSVDSELYYTYDGTVPDYPPGFETHRIYIQLQDSLDVLSSVWATTENYIEIGSSSGVIWNHSMGVVDGIGVLPYLCDFFPAFCYDSFVTIGHLGWNTYADGSEMECAQTVFASSNPSSVLDESMGNLELANNLIMNDGMWGADLVDTCNDQGRNGPNGKILIAQVTLPSLSLLEYKLNVTIYDNGDPESPLHYVWQEIVTGPDEIWFPQLWSGFVWDDSCMESICGDPMACNYDEQALLLCEKNCAYPGCDDPEACNYDANWLCEEEYCFYPACDNPDALNYDPDAVWTCIDNSTCLCDAPDVDCNGVVNTLDLLVFLGQLGCEGDDCPGDLDGDGVVSVMDLLIFLTVFP
jgi:hypothetical protein